MYLGVVVYGVQTPAVNAAKRRRKGDRSGSGDEFLPDAVWVVRKTLLRKHPGRESIRKSAIDVALRTCG